MPSLHWIGKEAVVNHHHAVPFHLLRDVPELSVGEPGAGNLIVQGDNLVALKALLPYYAGQVKCIYIDPPYNTGNEGWVYNDNVNSPLIREWLGKTVGKEAEDLSRHDKWLCMMYPRLALLRQFLREDGLIFVNLDDTETASCRLLMNDIFGNTNFLAAIAWEKRFTRSNNAKLFYSIKDSILVYRKSDAVSFLREPRTEKSDAIYKNPDNDPRGSWTSASYVNPATKEKRPNLVYSITNPITGEVVNHPTHAWKFEREQHEIHVHEKRLWWGKDGRAKFPRLKVFPKVENAGLVPVDLWRHDVAGTTDDGGFELKGLFGSAVFDNPKPTQLLERILQIATNPGDLILDSFAGSGTTGHAVLQLNAASAMSTAPGVTGNPPGFGVRQSCGAFPSLDQTDAPEKRQKTAALQDAAAPAPPLRRFILVEMEPKIARDITAERVKRVAQGYTNAKGERVEGLGGSFRFCELGEPLFDQHGQIRATVTFADLARHVYFTETGEPLPRERVSKSSFIGECRGVGVYLLFNGILGDKSANGGNILTRAALSKLPKFDGPKVIYASGCLLGRERLQAERITFRQTPYEIKVA